MSLFTLDGPYGAMIDAILKGTAFLLVLFLVSPGLRRLSAGARHLVWGTALVLLLSLPILSRVMPWRVGILPVPAVPAPMSDVNSPRNDQRTGAAPAPDAGTAADPSTTQLPSSPVTSESAPASVPMETSTILLLIWLAGIGVVLLRLGMAQFAAQRLVRSGTPVRGDDWEQARHWAAAHLGLDEPPPVLTTPLLPLPVTTGLTRPTILLPVEAEDWTAVRRESVLLHEMAHVQRKDLITHLFGRIVCAAWWFHPLAWRALLRLRAESERAADDLVLSAGRRASEYAQDLLAVVQDAGRSRAPIHALAMAQRSDFEGRLLAILEPGASRRGVTPMTAIPLVLAVSLVALPFAALGPAEAQYVVTPTPTPASTPMVMVSPVAPMTPVTPDVPVTVSLESATRSLNVRLSNLNVKINGISHGIRTTPDAATTRALVGLLDDPVADVRRAAVNSLANLGDTTVVAALVQALATDSDDGVRRAAAWALGQLEVSSAVPGLSTALRRDRDIEVRRNAAWALGQIEDASAVDALGAVLSDPDRELRRKAVWALGEIEDARAVPMLLPVLRDPDTEARSQAAWALGQIESKDAVEGLSRAVNDSSHEVRSHVAWALGQIEDASAVPALVRMLRDPIADVRKQAAWALGQVESATAVEGLTAALRDSDAEVRSQAAWALGQIEDPSAAAGLEGALRDDNAEVRKHAAWGLGQINLRRAPAGLITAFEDGDAEVRKTAAWAAGQIEDPAAIMGLTKLLSDSNREVQHNALWALGQIDDPRAMEGVTRLLRSSDAELRRMAAEALGRDH